MDNTEAKLPAGQFATEAERQKYEMDPANFDKLDGNTQARVAIMKFNGGQAIGVAEGKLIEAAIGGNGDGIISKEESDGVVTKEDLKSLEDQRNDTAFWQGTRTTMSAAAEYSVMSVGAGAAITAPGLGNPFGAAVQGMNVGQQFAPGLAPNAPGFKAPGLALNNFSPSPPTMGGFSA